MYIPSNGASAKQAGTAFTHSNIVLGEQQYCAHSRMIWSIHDQFGYFTAEIEAPVVIMYVLLEMIVRFGHWSLWLRVSKNKIVIYYWFLNYMYGLQPMKCISGLVVKSVVAIDGPRVRFTADALFLMFFACEGKVGTSLADALDFLCGQSPYRAASGLHSFLISQLVRLVRFSVAHFIIFSCKTPHDAWYS